MHYEDILYPNTLVAIGILFTHVQIYLKSRMVWHRHNTSSTQLGGGQEGEEHAACVGENQNPFTYTTCYSLVYLFFLKKHKLI